MVDIQILLVNWLDTCWDELLYVATDGKGRMMSTAAMPAIFLALKSRGRILAPFSSVPERSEAVNACALPQTHSQAAE